MKIGGRSSNVSDRRGMGGGPLMAGGGIGVVIVALVVMFLGGDPSEVLQQAAPRQQQQQRAPGEPDPQGDFVSGVLLETEKTWGAIFRDQLGREYEEPKLVLFTDFVQSGCGNAQTATGPFYCPLDKTVYIDLAFYNQLKERFGAPGDAAQAYVIAHEVGHHVQTLLGVSEQVMNARQRSSKAEANALSVRLELQADCYAGVWAARAHQERQILEPGDVEEAMAAAAAIGDDRMQKQSRGYISPESFTHGSSAQRQRWIRRGMETADIRQCDTFQSDI